MLTEHYLGPSPTQFRYNGQDAPLPQDVSNETKASTKIGDAKQSYEELNNEIQKLKEGYDELKKKSIEYREMPLKVWADRKKFEKKKPHDSENRQPKQDSTTNHQQRLCEYCDIYNTRAKAREDFECVVHNLTQPPTHLCIYNIAVDKWISGRIRNEGGWEKKEVSAVLKWVRDDPSMGFIDIGANIGMYTLTLATAGHQVVSLEPGVQHLMRVHRSIELGDLHDRITLLRNGVGDVRGVAKMLYFGGNNRAISSIEMLNGSKHQVTNIKTNPELYLHGDTGDKMISKDKKTVVGSEEYLKTIWLDDIIPFCHFNKAVIKIDIEGHEHKAFSHCQELFTKITIPYVLMEWNHVVKHSQKDKNDKDRQLFDKMLNFFLDSGYTPHRLNRHGDFPVLKVSDWPTGWPENVVWSL